MDIDMITKSASSTAGDHDHHHHNHNHNHQNHQLDMMTIMMQMEKPHPHQFCDPYQNSTAPGPTFLDINFSDGTSPPSSTTPAPAPIFHNPNVAPFMGSNPIQEPVTPPLQTNVVSGAGRIFKSCTGTGPGAGAILMGNPYEKRNSMAAMREMIFRIAAMQPIHIDPESIKPPKRRNVKISKDPQSVAARHRRERISERIRILQRLVPGGTKMDTASMLDEAIHYVKFLKKQVQTLEQAGANRSNSAAVAAATVGFPSSHLGHHNVNYSSFLKVNCQ